MSVIICTYNRAESLRRTLQTCCDLVIPEGVTWELLVVDNNSTDHTKRVCTSFTGKLPLRYLFESHQGKSVALNRGIKEAFAELLVFTDDDVDVNFDWLAAIHSSASGHPSATFFGGRVLPRWESTPPSWVEENLNRLPMNPHVDRGMAERFVEDEETAFFVGANFACRKHAFGGEISYHPDKSPSADCYIPGEDNVLQRELRAHGYQGFYVPAAIVHHRHAASRQTEKYVRKYHRGYGVAEVRNGEVPLVCLWFGAPRYYWKSLVLSGVKYVLCRFTCPSLVWLSAEIQMAHALGVIQECQRRASH